MTDLYEILGIQRNASDADIKSAHRRLVFQYHPDKNPNKQEAAKKAAEVNNAKEILLDPQKRAIYDRHGFKGLEEGFAQQSNRNLPVKNCSAQVDLDAFYSGKLIKFKVFLRLPCQFCSGFGCSDQTKKTTCTTCKGHGKVNYQHRIGPMVQTYVGDCQNCRGKGSSIDPRFVCQFCHGAGIVEQQKEIEHYVKKGQKCGNYLLENKGDYIDLTTIGHLQLTLEPVARSKFPFIRHGSNLHYDCNISLREALLGFEIVINHIEPDKKVVISSHSVVQPGETRKLVGWGMPKNANDFGDLYIIFSVELPTVITKEMRLSLERSLPYQVQRETPSNDDDRFPIEEMLAVEPDEDESDDEPVEETANRGAPQFHFGQGGGVQCAQQ